MTEHTSSSPWTPADAEELYAVKTWSAGFFSVNDKGHVAVRPIPGSDLEIDTTEVIDAAVKEGCTFPLIVRFQDIISARVRRLNLTFREAIAESGYTGTYRTIYPIKVNQLHEVVAEVMEAGKEFNLGLECGSRAELMATLALISDDTLLLCNGVKDHSMLTLMLNAQQLGQQVLPVIEKYSEFEQLLVLADQRGLTTANTPKLGVRVKLSTRGSGRWFESGGSGSKFGLTVPELVKLVHELEQRGASDSLELLHFHLGSQIADTQVLRSAVREIAQFYADLHKRGVKVKFLDVGGGLGVNYGGSYGGEYENVESSINYGLKEYANVIVFAVKDICDERDVPAPTLLSESGRAITAHHSMLVMPVIGVHRPDSPPMNTLAENSPPVVRRMASAYKEAKAVRARGALTEVIHDAQEARLEAEQLSRLGYLDLESLAQAESLYWSISREVLRKFTDLNLSPAPVEQTELETQLTDLYLADFSVFQSILDHWAIGQVFPIMPLDRLDEEPVRRGQIVDLTCDSDGKIDQYVSAHVNKSWLPLHDYRQGEPYYLAVFLVGAYQEILGDAHNLLGRAGEAHVYASADEPGNFWIEETIKAISIKDMLSTVQYFPSDLDRRMTELIRRKIETGVVKPAEGMRILNNYTKRLEDTTYCDTEVIRRVEQ
ncbi:MAG: biosynthetic arginine decarboxylase [Gammaproteobacteria bacterium]|nr:biosynthetic arginine decarboxylase [Gammaproteobacteria bacterium]MDP2141821.1 biosynthetic arginine decarboxylase [Gammaproteobacteria bacterium]MDP2348312.1 biosynthetic arginine decarboxylase [Gammaproteobacteria bacterium]